MIGLSAKRSFALFAWNLGGFLSTVAPCYGAETQVKPVWQYTKRLMDSDLCPTLQLARFNDSVLIQEQLGTLYALSLDNGKLLWKRQQAAGSGVNWPINGECSIGPIICNNLAFIGTEKGSLFCFDLDGEALKWQVNDLGPLLSKPCFGKDWVAFVTYMGMLECRDLSTGSLLWSQPIGQKTCNLELVNFDELPYYAATTPFEIEPNKVAVLNEAGEFEVFDVKKQGSEIGFLYTFQPPLQPENTNFGVQNLQEYCAPPLKDKDFLYLLPSKGALSAWKTVDGKAWEREFSVLISGILEMTIDELKLYVLDSKSSLFALDKSTGEIMWRYDLSPTEHYTAPVIWQDCIVTASQSGSLLLIDAVTGNLETTIQVDDEGIVQTPLVAEDQLIVRAASGNVYCYAANTRAV